MTTYYLDIETDTGGGKPNSLRDKIVTIQFQPFWDDSGKPKENLTILKSWESSEKEILEKFLRLTKWDSAGRHPFHFVPAGMSLGYEFSVIISRSKELLDISLPVHFFISSLAYYDVKNTLVLANGGRFTGCGLDNFTEKSKSGAYAGELIRNKEWDKLESYIKIEASEFLKLYAKLILNLPSILPKKNRSEEIKE